MTEKKRYDLDERTKKFAIDVRIFLRKVAKTRSNIEDGKQLIRSSGSVGANYIGASESLSKKDFYYRIKLCRKEIKESIFFLHLIDTYDSNSLKLERKSLINEGTELMKIFGSIITKAKN